jgi:hypothetical protein
MPATFSGESFPAPSKMLVVGIAAGMWREWELELFVSLFLFLGPVLRPTRHLSDSTTVDTKKGKRSKWEVWVNFNIIHNIVGSRY